MHEKERERGRERENDCSRNAITENLMSKTKSGPPEHFLVTSDLNMKFI